MLKVAIVDVIGLTYDPTTLEKYGLGGSESAVIYMARELQRVGFDVTVFNNCTDSRAQEGVYDGVKYVDLQRLHTPNDYTCDIMIGSRTVLPFAPAPYWNQFQYPPHVFSQLVNSAKLKVLWLHDTFCGGDHMVEEFVMNGHIHEIFTLSDFHTAYISNCDHGRRRNFEVLKDKLFMTRNGARRWIEEVDIAAKDRAHFVYNASITKGMLPLLEKIWPRVKQAIPEARLTVIGGYYRFRDGAEPDAQEKTFHDIVRRPEFKSLNVTFTGVIPQKEIAGILANAGFMIFPGAFPETFGISSLESLLYNTPLITTRFGALEETAVEQACYKIDYAIEPNSLFTFINTDHQVEKFVQLTIQAYRNHYLHQQKMHYCNIVRDIAGWDTVALQWKQHFFKKLGQYLPVDEYRKVSWINHRVHEVYGRRFSNKEEYVRPKHPESKHLLIVSPFYNAEAYIEDCILSVAQQDYINYTHVLIDDASTDSGYAKAKNTLDGLPEKLKGNFLLVKNHENKGSVHNYISAIRKFSHSDSVVMMLDGDDSLMPDPTIFDRYNTLYQNGAEFTYGSMWSLADNIPLVAQEYPLAVKQQRAYRHHKFNWNMPYTHLRTFIARLLKVIPDSVFKTPEGDWLRAGGDTAIFYNLIEIADPAQVIAVPDIVYRYNDKNPLNDYKVNGAEQTQTANFVLSQASPTNVISQPAITNSMPEKKKILLAIPTAKYIEVETFKSIYDLDVPSNVDLVFQYFYGYNVDQVRNLIAHWAEHFDYLFSVDSDIVLPKDTLTKMLSHNVDIVSGVYIQRKHGVEIPEIYRKNTQGGMSNVPIADLLSNPGLQEIDGCGFGCVLVNSDVIRKIGYPQFVYKSALNHAHTISEDVYFCMRAREVGAKLFVDSSIVCPHIGSYQFFPQAPIVVDKARQKLTEIANVDLLPQVHKDYLVKMRDDMGVKPQVIYDIGACVLHWTRAAKRIWTDARYICFEAMDETKFLYEQDLLEHHNGVLGSIEGQEVDFYQNLEWFGGNSYYRENPELNPFAETIFNSTHIVKKKISTLDNIVQRRGFPPPDLIKIDVQGAELDVLKGAEQTLKHCQHLIIELQHREYNIGAPNFLVVIQYLASQGFVLVADKFCFTENDGDYHFMKIQI